MNPDDRSLGGGTPPGDSAADRTADGLPADPGAPADLGSLEAALRLAIDHPDEARRLLEALEGRSVAVGAARRAEAEGPGGGETVPLLSRVLARSSRLPLVGEERVAPSTMFAWAGQLTRDEILTAGRVVDDMVSHGAPRDLTRSVGIAWSAGAKVPRRELRALLPAFVELEVTVTSVLAGRDLRQVPDGSSKTSFAAALGSLFARSNPRQAEASMVLEHAGRPAQRGLVALWNAWAAMRYRELVPAPVFDQLVGPWVNVVGPLPEA
jgi:hypothetical protein